MHTSPTRHHDRQPDLQALRHRDDHPAGRPNAATRYGPGPQPRRQGDLSRRHVPVRLHPARALEGCSRRALRARTAGDQPSARPLLPRLLPNRPAAPGREALTSTLASVMSERPNPTPSTPAGGSARRRVWPGTTWSWMPASPLCAELASASTIKRRTRADQDRRCHGRSPARPDVVDLLRRRRKSWCEVSGRAA